jgi:hypothetical protein
MRQLPRPAGEPGVVCGRDPEQLGDNADRQRVGKSLTSSISSPLATADSKSWVISVILGVSVATTRGVKALATSRRSLVWSCGSSERNDPALRSPFRRATSAGISNDRSRSLLARGSRKMREHASYLANTTRAPSSSANGDASRNRASSGYGLAITAGSASVIRSVSPGRSW